MTASVLDDARSLLRVVAHVATYRGSDHRRMFIVTPFGRWRAAMMAAALTTEHGITLGAAGSIIVTAHDDDESSRLLTVLHDAALPDQKE